MSAPYDPKLREAMLEFRALCAKYDCMGAILLVSRTHAEFGNVIDPTWSVMHFEKDPEGGGRMAVRFRSKKEDFPSKEAQHEATEATAHGVTSIMNWARQTHDMWASLLTELQKHMKVFFTVWDEPDSVPGDDAQ
ncbi:MAG TPA: hypothetical protein VL588_11415 [Bdellovibrionota bacterium]|nr:hypothetical protein [Bdellovibrionota bacterium]